MSLEYQLGGNIYSDILGERNFAKFAAPSGSPDMCYALAISSIAVELHAKHRQPMQRAVAMATDVVDDLLLKSGVARVDAARAMYASTGSRELLEDICAHVMKQNVSGDVREQSPASPSAAYDTSNGRGRVVAAAFLPERERKLISTRFGEYF